ncbi:MAG: L,D-transpeptidase [Micrococcales bacterium]|nr:L,D-transpeptidase [Micrococcales bacterium]MCL2666544.1 L,D-transpeptidase [Micrococcales bacterium]
MRWFAVIIGFVLVLTGCSSSGSDSSEPPAQDDSVDLSTLPVADPWALFPQAPPDPDPFGIPTGEVAYPDDEDGIAVYDAPDGTPFAVLPVEPYRVPTGYPVVAHSGDWLQVMLVARRDLPSKVGPDKVNAVTGWVYGPETTTDMLDTLIQADLTAGTVSIITNGEVTTTTEAGFGKPETPTPPERTFVMSITAEEGVTYSRVFLYLGSHSPTLDIYKDGPAPIAIHAYSTHSGYISDGCVRIPDDQLDAFAAVPVGTPVVFVT